MINPLGEQVEVAFRTFFETRTMGDVYDRPMQLIEIVGLWLFATIPAEVGLWHPRFGACSGGITRSAGSTPGYTLTSLRDTARAGEWIKFLESGLESLGRTEPSGFPTPKCLDVDTYFGGQSLTTEPVFLTITVKSLSNFTPGIVQKGNTWGFVALGWSKGRIFEWIVAKIANDGGIVCPLGLEPITFPSA